jgi:hypothetical protein
MGRHARDERPASWPAREEVTHALTRRILRPDASFTRTNTCKGKGTRGSSDEFYEFVNLRGKDVSVGLPDVSASHRFFATTLSLLSKAGFRRANLTLPDNLLLRRLK